MGGGFFFATENAWKGFCLLLWVMANYTLIDFMHTKNLFGFLRNLSESEWLKFISL